MKKIFLFLGVVMALSLAACGEKVNQSTNETDEVDSTFIDSAFVDTTAIADTLVFE